ncbi:MAG TPA: GntR family transcriptional regulator [Actinokineospora sp.]|nr:GntR family transcriptional regulator [Actinokineospora sp.]
MGTHAKPGRELVRDGVYENLRLRLVSRSLTPGTRLNLVDLGRELHVSNTPIRRALERLEAEGLVTREPNRGFAASPLLDERAITELYDYRLLLEPSAAARAARGPHDALLDKLAELAPSPELGELVDDPAAALALRERDFRFHTLIAQAAGNSVVAKYLTAALASMGPYTLYHDPAAITVAWEEHRKIVDAIRAGDADRASDAMRVHLSQARLRLRNAVERPVD